MSDQSPRYDIVIPHYGAGGLTVLLLKCLQSILAAGGDYRVILVDNNSPEFDRLAEAIAAFEARILIVRSSVNLGFIKATNLGLSLSNAEYVVLLNNDTEVPPGWLSSLEEAFHLYPQCGLSGPLTNAQDSWQGRWQPDRGQYRLTAPHVHLLAPGRMLAFFCTMIHRRVFESIGLLDESYGVGFGDDDDYCRRAEDASFQLCLQQNLLVVHHHRSTFKTLHSAEEIQRLQDEAMARFRATGPPPERRRRSNGRLLKLEGPGAHLRDTGSSSPDEQ